MNIVQFLTHIQGLGIHLSIEGQDILIDSNSEEISSEIIEEIKNRKKEIVKFLSNSSTSNNSNIKLSEQKEFYKVSSNQYRFYFLQQLNLSSVNYNMPFIYRIPDEVNLNNLQLIFNQLVERHEILRSYFKIVNNNLVQIIEKNPEFKCNFYEIDENDVKSFLSNIIKPFDLFRYPLFRVNIIKIKNDVTLLVLDMHHIISDGISHEILIKEFYSLKQNVKLATNHFQYKDYAEWQNSQFFKDKIRKQENYWINEFNGDIPILDLPIDYSRPSLMSFRGSSLRFELSKEETERVCRLAQDNNVTMYMFLLSCLYVLLHKLSQQEDIVIGTLIGGRQNQELLDIIGPFVNTLAIRNSFNENNSFLELIEQVRVKVIHAFENQDYPFDKLVEKISKIRDASRNPLFDVMFSYNTNMSSIKYEKSEEVRYENYNIEDKTSKFDLRLSGSLNERLYLSFEYCIDLFDKRTIERYVSYFKNIILTVIKNVNVKISDIDITSDEERNRLLYLFNQTEVSHPSEKSINVLFQEQAAKTPDKVCLVDGDIHFTYSELSVLIKKLAVNLKNKGVIENTVVGILLDRSLEAVISILGILEANGSYLIIDKELPFKRIKYYLDDSDTKFLITKSTFLSHIPELRNMDVTFIDKVEEDPQCDFKSLIPNNPKAVAYVLYTSGSTGTPKGVLVNHKGLTNYVCYAKDKYLKNRNLNFPLYTSLSFDLTITSIFVPLISGNTIKIIRETTNIPDVLKSIIEDDFIGAIKITPGHLKIISFLNIKIASSIKCLIAGGENLETSLASKIDEIFNSNIEIYNEYGPTETVVGCTIFEFDRNITNKNSVSIGKPVDNAQIYILGNNQKILPIGICGDIYISGDGVALGYLNNEILTNQKFIRIPELGNKRLYKSGDIGRWDIDGNLEFFGRSDNQVKIKGYRIELGEIEDKIKSFKFNDYQKYYYPTHKTEEFKRCKCCLMTNNHKNLVIDDDGVCNECKDYEKNRVNISNFFKDQRDLKKIVDNIKVDKQAKYDCILLYSGGKDSSYVLYKLIDNGLRVLTLTFDNGYISDYAFENIKTITSRLNVENIIRKTPNINKVFVESLKSDSNVCTGCWHALNTVGLEVAKEYGIKTIFFFLFRGQIIDMRLKGLFKMGIFKEEEIEEKLLLFRKSFHSESNRYFKIIKSQISPKEIEIIHFIDYFRYDNITTNQILEYLSSKGWVQPEDTGFCSSNCVINDVGIYVNQIETGFHFYEEPLSWDCRLSLNTREKLLKEVGHNIDNEKVYTILNEIGYFNQTIKDAVVIERKGADGESYLCAYIISDEEINYIELKKHLSNLLPEYMLPTHFIQVDKIPLTINGKIDSKALSKLNKYENITLNYIAPSSSLEKLIVEVWSEVLERNDIGTQNNFFELGGNSYKAVQVINKLEQRLNEEISISKLFEYPTISKLASFIKNRNLDKIETEADVEINFNAINKLKSIRNNNLD